MKNLIIKRKDDDTLCIDEDLLINNICIAGMLIPSLTGNFTNCAYYLNSEYHWVLGKDSEGETILVPLKKK